MKKYELVVIVDAQNTQDIKDTILKQATDVIEKNDGKIINSQTWFEKQKFTFRIKKCSEGTYYLINFETPGSAISKIRQVFKINEKILRFEIFDAE